MCRVRCLSLTRVNSKSILFQSEGDIGKVSKVDISLLNIDLEDYDVKVLETCLRIIDKKKRECI